MRPLVRVVGLGPGDLDHVTRRTLTLLVEAPVVRLRTRRHPGADHFAEIESYDEWYEREESFESLYEAIVDDLVRLAGTSPNGEVVYAVPGSPVVAERTVELLRERNDVLTVVEPAVSIIDLACAAMGRDPLSVGLRVTDALDDTAFVGPGPFLVLQTYAPEVVARVIERLTPGGVVTVLYHLGLGDQRVEEVNVEDLARYDDIDHLTSLWVDDVRDAATATSELLAVAKRLRAECPWDQEQTHASLTRHLLEETYEVLDALDTFVRLEASDPSYDAAAHHVEEELGDVLFQVVFHAELGDEAGLFDFASVADAVREKLIGRHPHVFADATVRDATEVAERWESLKRIEKGRESVTDGVPWQLPALTLYTKLLRKAAAVDLAPISSDEWRDRASAALAALPISSSTEKDSSSVSDVDVSWGDAMVAIVSAAQREGVDLEGVLRERARALRDVITSAEAASARERASSVKSDNEESS